MIFFVVISLLSRQAFATASKVIYGSDDRIEVYQSENELHKLLALSTAAKILKRATGDEGEYFEIRGGNLVERFNYCPTERFTQQLLSANCSGFLITEDILVTAGHCMTSRFDCEAFYWVFDFRLGDNGENVTHVPKSSIYKCSEILEQEYDPHNEYFENDYAIVRLDRPVTDRAPVKVRTQGKVEDNTKLMIIGHPVGLPTKISNNAWVRENSHFLYFYSNLDAYGGNSGSAVFDAQTGVVEGILVLGEDDYEKDPVRGCNVSKVCADDECNGEQVIRITSVPLKKYLN